MVRAGFYFGFSQWVLSLQKKEICKVLPVGFFLGGGGPIPPKCFCCFWPPALYCYLFLLFTLLPQFCCVLSCVTCMSYVSRKNCGVHSRPSPNDVIVSMKGCKGIMLVRGIFREMLLIFLSILSCISLEFHLLFLLLSLLFFSSYLLLKASTCVKTRHK